MKKIILLILVIIVGCNNFAFAQGSSSKLHKVRIPLEFQLDLQFDFPPRLADDGDIVFVRNNEDEKFIIGQLLKINTTGEVEILADDLPGEIWKLKKNSLNNSYVLLLLHKKSSAPVSKSAPASLVEVSQDGDVNVIYGPFENGKKSIHGRDFAISNENNNSEYFISTSKKVFKVITRNKVKPIYGGGRIFDIEKSLDEKKILVQKFCNVLSVDVDSKKSQRILPKKIKRMMCRRFPTTHRAFELFTTSDAIFLTLAEFFAFFPSKLSFILNDKRAFSITSHRASSFHLQSNNLYVVANLDGGRDFKLLKANLENKEDLVEEDFVEILDGDCIGEPGGIKSVGEIVSHSGDSVVVVSQKRECTFLNEPDHNIIIYEYDD